MADRDGDVLIVGSGPAGIAAAFPMVEAGLRVLLVDGGQVPGTRPPDGEYLALRRHDRRQAEWMLGRDARALVAPAVASPKFRVPGLEFAFRDFGEANRIEAEGFELVGSLAVGGLSNAWGCGVARFDAADWGGLPVDEAEWSRALAAVAERIGLSGRADDDLSAFFGVDAHARPPLALDALHDALAQGYARRRELLRAQGFRLGRARVAVLTDQPRERRETCDGRGLCLWGCARESMYASRHDLPALHRHSGFSHLPGHLVLRLVPEAGGWRAEIRRRDGTRTSLRCRRVVLAAGTIATTAIVMRSLPGLESVRLMHLPSAAFALAMPRHLGRAVAPGPGFAQLAFALDGERPHEVCGYTFSTHGLPVVEFLRHAPVSRAGARAALRIVLPSMLVANCFLPARLSASRMRLRGDGAVRIEGGESDETAAYAASVRERLARAFRAAGGRMLPGSFRRAAVGADVHYASTLPMREDPGPGESSIDGELAGLPGVFVADGAALPTLPAKSHTLAIMANAHRIATRLAAPPVVP